MRWKTWYYFFSFLLVVSLLFTSVIGGFANKAHAITYGEPDGEDHPYVGIVAVYYDDGTFFTRGSGILISPTVVLTAGHVTWPAQNIDIFHNKVRVSFVSDLSQFVDPPDFNDSAWAALSCTGTPITHPDYYPDNRNFPNTCDVGVIVLDQEVVMDHYGELPDIGALDRLATKRGRQEQIFTTVGYGFQSVRPFLQFDVVRYKATSMLVNLRSALTDGYNLHTSNNPGKGQGTGGSCFGDSGGPVFFDDTSDIAAIVSFGLNNNCKGADFGYRMDIPESQDFVLTYIDN